MALRRAAVLLASRTRCFMDISISAKPVGRLSFELFHEVSTCMQFVYSVAQL